MKKKIIENDIFISHSKDDFHIAQEIYDNLKKREIKCYMAAIDTPSAGSNWLDDIRENLSNSSRIILLITPRSKNRPWIFLEGGAAWIMNLEIIPVLMFVDESELIFPFLMKQAVKIETHDKMSKFIDEIVANVKNKNNLHIDGCWLCKKDIDKVFFQRKGNKVVGIYDYEGNGAKTGKYIGIIEDNTIKYSWQWFDYKYKGSGILEIINNYTLSGQWWYDDKPDQKVCITYNYNGPKMPSWLCLKDFEKIWKTIK